ncbi:MAG: phosphoenolpyruvate synthase PpsA [Desulfobacteraceae bacterium 4572_187]|nr:MAG: phosphoenolpyruvate synthase PpsA [Desulfobacteraceae bacterium 4572_187]
MTTPNTNLPNNDLDDFDLSFKVFHELMAKKVTEILLVSSPYDAFIMEEEGRLAERIIHEYRGLNLSRPPKLTWVSTAQEALNTLSNKEFDLVITMPRLDDMDAFNLGRKIKKICPELPIYLLAHNTNRLLLESKQSDLSSIDKLYVWYGNSDLLLALIKNTEDQMNVAYDTKRAKVRVIILVEDSPIYYSSFLPILYKEIVRQTQAVMEESLNDEHRILRMRARPKILVAENYEEAEKLYRQFKPYLLSVFSDVRFPRKGKMDNHAGFDLLSMIKKETPDIPLLNLSSEEANRKKAEKISAVFLNKNSPTLHSEIRSFFMDRLGFGDFIFRLPNGREIARASNLREMEKILPSIPDKSISFHAARNHFSSWLMARSEILLASKLKPLKASDFSNIKELKDHLIASIQERRKGRQKGIITDFVSGAFDPDADFMKIGKGSLGGKARGLAFMSTQLKKNPHMLEKFKDITISVPKTLVISTEAFDSFINENKLRDIPTSDYSDNQISEIFLQSSLPDWLHNDLKLFIEHIDYPLAIRSSSLLEDAQFQPFAGIYKTYMLPNQDRDPAQRLIQLVVAIKLVYASTYLEIPRAYARSTLHRTEDEKMAVIIQQLSGGRYGDYFYPTLAGVAQSYNFYPISHMKPEEGIAHIALGLGKTVVEGETSLRFSPKYPQFLPQFSTVDDILKNSQRFFYALKMVDSPESLESPESFASNGKATDDATLIKLEIDDALDYAPVVNLSSTYIPEENRIRDTGNVKGYRVLTFAGILKYDFFPLPQILTEILKIGRKGMGSPVEIEFSVNIDFNKKKKPEFSLLQIRPMAINMHNRDVEITEKDRERAFCFSTMALGNGKFKDITDIIYVRPDSFDPARTVEIAGEIGKVNRQMLQKNKKYLLIGPGRWGSADRWLGIPVTWKDISGISAVVETTAENLKADPSQGSHFFHNITSLGISYLTIKENDEDFLDIKWLKSLLPESETDYLRHVKLDRPITLKIDGKKSQAVLIQ